MGLKFVTITKLTRHEILEIDTLTGKCGIDCLGIQELESQIDLGPRGRGVGTKGGGMNGVRHLWSDLVVPGEGGARGNSWRAGRMGNCVRRLLVHHLSGECLGHTNRGHMFNVAVSIHSLARWGVVRRVHSVSLAHLTLWYIRGPCRGDTLIDTDALRGPGWNEVLGGTMGDLERGRRGAGHAVAGGLSGCLGHV